MNEGLLYIISAPSGSGKGTVISAVKKIYDNVGYAISATTRDMRPDEEEGVSYFFKTEEEFDRLLEAEQILECDYYCRHRYGTLKSEIERNLSEGKDILLDITVNGAMNIKRIMGDKAVTVFILPPSIEELRRRIELRMTETPQQIDDRIKTAIEYEIPSVSQFEYVVVNDDLDEAVADIKAIILAEKKRTIRNKTILTMFSK